jgi:hypothetical protein
MVVIGTLWPLSPAGVCATAGITAIPNTSLSAIRRIVFSASLMKAV